MNKTNSISFPRSGHHALRNVLAEYFGEEFKYCDNYVDPQEKRLGVDLDTNYQKEHDLTLEYPAYLPYRQLIQIRNPFDAIQSWINFDATVGHEDANQNRERWHAVFNERTRFWGLWFDKWVLSPAAVPRLVVPYERLVADPAKVCSSVILFLTNQHADPARLREALVRFPICAQPARPPSLLTLV